MQLQFLNSIFFHLRITSVGKITSFCFEVLDFCHFMANFKMLKDNILDSFWLENEASLITNADIPTSKDIHC